MPIYAYACSACGHAQDHLQKMSAPKLDTCPQCGAVAYQKQVTAAGFQLKGSGWYVTDFRNNDKKDGSKEAPKKTDAASGDAAKSGSDSASSTGSSDSATPAPAPAPTPAPAAAPAAAAVG